MVANNTTALNADAGTTDARVEPVLTVNRPAPPVPPQPVNPADPDSGKPSVVLHRGQRDLFFREIAETLAESGHVFRRHGEVWADHGGPLTPIADGGLMAHLAMRLVALRQFDGGPLRVVRLSASDGKWLLRSSELTNLLPEIHLVTEVPVLDEHQDFVQPGYNAGCGVYYQGPALKPAADRPHLNALLQVFRFQAAADSVSYLAFLLTLLLGRRFAGGRPMGMLRGNRPGVGKTTAANVLATLATRSARLPSLTYTTNDEEFEKAIGALVNWHPIILIDNVRARQHRPIGSPCLERTLTAPTYNFRRLGKSSTITGENYLQFFATSNGGQLNPDLASRTVDVNFYCPGNPAHASLPGIGEPLEYARTHRLELLAELMGMIGRWKVQGPTEKAVSCRFQSWARMLGGILAANGFADFRPERDVGPVAARATAPPASGGNGALTAALPAVTVRPPKPTITQTILPTPVRRRPRRPVLHLIVPLEAVTIET